MLYHLFDLYELSLNLFLFYPASISWRCNCLRSYRSQHTLVCMPRRFVVNYIFSQFTAIFWINFESLDWSVKPFFSKADTYANESKRKYTCNQCLGTKTRSDWISHSSGKATPRSQKIMTLKKSRVLVVLSIPFTEWLFPPTTESGHHLTGLTQT